MTHHTQWQNEGKILYTELSETTDYQEIEVVFAETTALISKFPNERIFHILNVSELQNVNIKLTEVTKVLNSRPANLYAVLVILRQDAKNRMFHFIGAFAVQVVKIPVRFFFDLQDAFAYIGTLDQISE